jgi:hypothetical protein
MARFMGCLTPWIEGGGRGNRRGMLCNTRGSYSMAGEARAVLGGGARPAVVVPALFSTGRKKKAGWAGWAKWPNRLMGRLDRVWPETEEEFISE